MMLNEMTLAKLLRTTRIGSDSSTILLDAIGRPSMTPIATGSGAYSGTYKCGHTILLEPIRIKLSKRQQQQTRSRFTPTYASVMAQSPRQQYSPVPTPRQARSPTPMEIDMTRAMRTFIR